jgi:hypothetical protein
VSHTVRLAVSVGVVDILYDLRVIPVSTGTTVMYCTDVKPLVRDEVTLWNNQQQDSGILELPFEFTLPTDLPPAFHAHQDHWYKATISYAVQVVAERHGLLRFNRRIGQTFPVLPLATDGQADIATRLSQGWDGDLKTSEKTELVRKGLWGDHAKVEGQVTEVLLFDPNQSLTILI